MTHPSIEVPSSLFPYSVERKKGTNNHSIMMIHRTKRTKSKNNNQTIARTPVSDRERERDVEIGYDDNAIVCNLDVEPVKDCPWRMYAPMNVNNRTLSYCCCFGWLPIGQEFENLRRAAGVLCSARSLPVSACPFSTSSLIVTVRSTQSRPA